MLGPELLAGILFYVVAALFAWIGYPLTVRIFQSKILAYVTAKLVGLCLFGYCIWALSSFQVLHYQNQWLITSLLVVLIGVGLIATYRQMAAARKLSQKPRAASQHKPLYQRVLIVEAAGLVVYLAYLVLRSHNADINGTERFMDMALLAGSGKTDFFPFIDAWYAGKTINYYYYGSYLMSLLANLSRLPYDLSYNFALGLIYSYSTILAGTFIHALGTSKKIAALGALLLTTAGTLFFASCTIRAALPGSTATCGYASSTRLYDPSYIINEIPSYSFTVGDLHAHLLALPFFLLALALLYAVLTAERPRALLTLLLAVTLATCGMINAWDLITLACLSGLIILIKLWQSRHSRALQRTWLLYAGVTAFVVALCMWPALRSFENPVLGIGFAPSFVRTHALSHVQWPTPIAAELGMWGVLLLGSTYALRRFRRNLSDHAYPIVLIILGVGIIIGVELFFIKDIYSVANPPYFRANTTFKFGYHAWALLCIACTVLLGRLMADVHHIRFSIRAKAASWILLAVVFGLVYPYKAIREFYLTAAHNPTLRGAAWMKRQTPDDFAAVQYMNDTFHERTVIAEAVGDSYTTYARMATFTGNITPMGWKTHEWTWRFQGQNVKTAAPGETPETGWTMVSSVASDIELLYETTSTEQARGLLDTYNIAYVYVGNLERTTYPNLAEDKFMLLGSPVFSSGTSTLYKIR